MSAKYEIEPYVKEFLQRFLGDTYKEEYFIGYANVVETLRILIAENCHLHKKLKEIRKIALHKEWEPELENSWKNTQQL